MSDFNTEHNKVVWLDISVVDLDRAVVRDSEGNRLAIHGRTEN